MTSHSFTFHGRGAGFSLIEFLIAIFITLFLVAGMMGIIVSMRGSFRTQDQLERAQENQRFALTVLDNTIRDAGFFSNPTVTTPATAFPATTTVNADGTTFVVAQVISGTTGAATASDTINVRFQTVNGDGLMNCLGDTNTTGAAITWTNSFAVNASSQLVCAVNANAGTPSTPIVLVDNVASMKVLFGIDTNADSSADKYVESTAISSTADWTNVNSVRLQITFLGLVDSNTGASVSLPVLTHNISLMNKS